MGMLAHTEEAVDRNSLTEPVPHVVLGEHTESSSRLLGAIANVASRALDGSRYPLNLIVFVNSDFRNTLQSLGRASYPVAITAGAFAGVPPLGLAPLADWLTDSQSNSAGFSDVSLAGIAVIELDSQLLTNDLDRYSFFNSALYDQTAYAFQATLHEVGHFLESFRYETLFTYREPVYTQTDFSGNRPLLWRFALTEVLQPGLSTTPRTIQSTTPGTRQSTTPRAGQSTTAERV